MFWTSEFEVGLYYGWPDREDSSGTFYRDIRGQDYLRTCISRLGPDGLDTVEQASSLIGARVLANKYSRKYCLSPLSNKKPLYISMQKRDVT